MLSAAWQDKICHHYIVRRICESDYWCARGASRWEQGKDKLTVRLTSAGYDWSWRWLQLVLAAGYGWSWRLATVGLAGWLELALAAGYGWSWECTSRLLLLRHKVHFGVAKCNRTKNSLQNATSVLQNATISVAKCNVQLQSKL